MLDTLEESVLMIAPSILQSSFNTPNFVPPIDNLPIALNSVVRSPSYHKVCILQYFIP